MGPLEVLYINELTGSHQQGELPAPHAVVCLYIDRHATACSYRVKEGPNPRPRPNPWLWIDHQAKRDRAESLAKRISEGVKRQAETCGPKTTTRGFLADRCSNKTQPKGPESRMLFKKKRRKKVETRNTEEGNAREQGRKALRDKQQQQQH